MSESLTQFCGLDQPQASLEQLLGSIAALPENWHGAGSVSVPVLYAIVRHLAGRRLTASVETGAGKTTLLFSNLSDYHRVFAKEDGNQSITLARNSPLLNADRVEFIEGCTQVTLPSYQFGEPLDLVLCDGPHGFPFPELEYYFLYQHLATDALFLLDDIQIPTIYRLFEFLREDEMFELLEVVENTAFFRRTDAPTFCPTGDGWWEQSYNKRRFPVTNHQRSSRGGLYSQALRPLKRVAKALLKKGP